MKRVLFLSLLLLIGTVATWAGPTTPPFTQCPAVGLDTGCQLLIVIDTNGVASVLEDKAQGPYEGVEDALVGVQNNSSMSIGSLPLSSTTDIFGFDGDGLCTVTPFPAACLGGGTSSGHVAGDLTGYAGPGVMFTGINAAQTAGTVVFTTPIAPGGSAYFSLEEALTASQITVGNPSGVPEPASLMMMGVGAGLALLLYRRRAA